MLRTSVALGTFNGARFLKVQLESLAAQTLLPAELVVCDDGSEDKTVEIVRAFAQRSPFPVVLEVNGSRLGFRRNFMKAAKLCASDLVSFCDQDDVWRNDKIARMTPFFEDPDVLLAYHDAALVDVDLARLGTLYNHECVPVAMPARGRPWWNPNGFTQVFRRSLLKHSDLRECAASYESDEVALAHDQWVTFLAWALGKTCHLQVELASYRQHDSNLYGQKQTGLSKRIHHILEDRNASYQRMALVSRSFASVLHDVAREETVPFDKRARMSADALLELAFHYESRAEVCSGETFAKRLSAYTRLRRTGLYNDDAGWSFGRKALLKDFVLGVVFGTVAKSLRPAGSLGDVIVSRK